LKPDLAFVDSILSKIKKENLYRRMHYGKISGPYITINNKKLINFCSNDYLGLTTKFNFKNQIQSSSRLVSGNDTLFKTLEKKLARHKSQESSLVFPTGYMANLGAIATLVGKNDLILSDELNHVSIIEACRLTKAVTRIYNHNDLDDLGKKIRKKHRRKFIITEGVFSMDGDLAHLREISEIAEKSNAILVLDDAHGDFTIGKDGKGTANFLGVSKKIDLYISSLSKGLGSFGGYVASKNNVINLLVNKSKSFIYTSALPSIFVEDALNKLGSVRVKQQVKLQKNIVKFCKGLQQVGFNIKSKTHIIPIVIGNEKATLDFGKFLFSKGIFAQPIRFPTVPKGKARIRVSITARLNENHISHAINIFEIAGKKFKIL